jgi:predicted neuraminidase
MPDVLLREEINQPTTRFAKCHCSTIVELPSGDLLAAWYAGSGEAKRDVAVVASRKAKGEESWGSLQVISDTPGKPEGNCVLFHAPDGKLWVVFALMHGKLDGPHGPGVRWATCDVRSKTSLDEGLTWSETRLLREEIGMVARCKPIILYNGDVVMGFEHHLGYAYFMLSSDDGLNWSWVGPLGGVPNQHPTLIQRKDESVLALLRPCHFKRIARSTSHDNGRTWEDAVNTDLPNPGAAVDMVKLSDGRVVLAFNNSHQHRNPLTLALSEDEGETWPHKRDLVVGKDGRFGYPAIVQDRDGLLHVTYTRNRLHIDHVVVEPDWVLGG